MFMEMKPNPTCVMCLRTSDLTIQCTRQVTKAIEIGCEFVIRERWILNETTYIRMAPLGALLMPHENRNESSVIEGRGSFSHLFGPSRKWTFNRHFSKKLRIERHASGQQKRRVGRLEYKFPEYLDTFGGVEAKFVTVSYVASRRLRAKSQ